MRLCGVGLPGTEPSSDGVSISSSRDASGASPGAGRAGLRGQGYTKHSWTGAAVPPGAGGCWSAAQAASQHHQSPCWAAGAPWDVPIPTPGACLYGDTCLPRSCCPWDEVVAVFAFPASRGESSAPVPAVATFWQVPEPYAPSLHSDPHHLQSPLGPPKPVLGHHMQHLV